MEPSVHQIRFRLQDYDLAGTLDSGQAFRWRQRGGAWEGFIGPRWVRLTMDGEDLLAETSGPVGDWRWLSDYLQLETDFGAVLATFPDDEPMRAAVSGCRGLRLLRQPYWECLASFILSSTKQIVQIRQIVALLSERFGDPVGTLGTGETVHAFPTAERIAACTEAELRACKMGFRAPYLLGTAQMVARGEVDLEALQALPTETARGELLRLPGVGRKIADCVLLFAYGFQDAFPVDVWVRKALQQLYFPKRRASEKRLLRFSATYFGPNAGYAQQYLFHYMRTKRIPVAQQRATQAALRRRSKKQ
jgi:N-glycosylase/DNA lyase